MPASSRRGSTIGALIALALALGHAAPATASRPTTTVDAARAARAIVAARVTVRAGGGRGGQTGLSRTARHDAPAPPPTTRRPPTDAPGSIATAHQEGRRAPDLRVTATTAARDRRKGGSIAVAVGDRRATVPGAVFHDANAPPAATATAVAGLDA